MLLIFVSKDLTFFLLLEHVVVVDVVVPVEVREDVGVVVCVNVPVVVWVDVGVVC